MELVDTHCHVHEAVRRVTPVFDKWYEKGEVDADKIIADAAEAGVTTLICIGTTLEDSQQAVEFADEHDGVYASVGIHPHEARTHKSTSMKNKFKKFLDQNHRTNVRVEDVPFAAGDSKIVAVGECGLDYFYTHSPRQDQIDILRFQIGLALEHDLPLSFHVREAFDDFWPIFDELNSGEKKIRGVLHSFTDSTDNLQRAVKNGLFVGVNGIATFSKKAEMYKAIPPENLLLETDAPFLAPVPFRGQTNQPKRIRTIAEFLAKLRSEPLEEIAKATTDNAHRLFKV